MVAIPSEESCESSAGVPLLAGEQREEAERVPSPTSEDSVSTIAPETGTATNSGQIDESTQVDSFWHRRRLENYPGISRNDPDVWSLFTRTTIRSIANEPEEQDLDTPYWGFQILSKSPGVWFFEALALIISLSSFAGIVILLIKYDGELQPEFTDQISINAIIAVFSTILRATLLFILSEVIGELKWNWMESPRRLRDIVCFINAGTGLVGSLKFLFFSWKPILTIVSAIVVIASSAIGPFSQQASATYTCDQSVEQTAQILVTYNASSAMTPEMRGAAVNGLMYGSADNSLATSSLFSCPARNCKFKSSDGITHTSVGICSTCIEQNAGSMKTDGADNAINQLRLSWNNGTDSPFVLDMKAEFKPMPGWDSLGAQSKPSFAFGSLLGEEMTILIRVLNKGSSMPSYPSRNESRPDVLAVDCTIYPCSRTYYGEIVNGTFKENVISESRLPYVFNYGPNVEKTTSADFGGFIKFTEPCCFYGHCYYTSNISQALKSSYAQDQNWTSWEFNDEVIRFPTKCTSILGADTYGSVQDFVNKTILGSCTVFGHGQYKNSGTAQCGEKWWINSVFRKGNASFQSVDEAFHGMATSITNLMRSNGSDWDGLPHARVTGSSSIPAICVQVYWAWLLYPGSLLVLTTGLFVYTFVESKVSDPRRPVWKSNILPLIFYGIKTKTSSSDGHHTENHTKVPLMKLAELEVVADNTIVQFHSHIDSPGFVAEEGEHSLGSVLAELKEGGMWALANKEKVRPQAEASKTTSWLRKRRPTGGGGVV
ncbi:hypothetical protein CGCS363_v005811 [Colletotrichum siamense]|uniref:uncharacterized protein n=1 Tax=Colletotrichum siamense TaxID=690259 RepID=UPI00187300AA|nr:uncharacterized protein CGCS363_v005811 [Colletotrichum siamense]KAF5506077.1 hypothetical protein CGCS363_v005811 [Colletotrichum siamense]